MKEINLNDYLLYCYGLIIILIIYTSKFEYSENIDILNHSFNTDTVLSGIIMLLITLPFEIVAAQSTKFIFSKQNFNIKFLFSERKIHVT